MNRDCNLFTSEIVTRSTVMHGFRGKAYFEKVLVDPELSLDVRLVAHCFLHSHAIGAW